MMIHCVTELVEKKHPCFESLFQTRLILTNVLNVFFLQVVMPQRQSSGRKRDQVWNYFETLAKGRAKCKDCPFDIVPLAERMKKHRLIYDGNEDEDVPTKNN